MTYTFDHFCADSHAAMAKNIGRAGREEIRRHLESLLVNKSFIAEHLVAQCSGKTLLYHDRDFDFYVIAALMLATARASPMIMAHHGQSMGRRQGSLI